MASQRTPPFTLDECKAKAKECRAMAARALKPEHRVMLEHMAETWDRICQDLAKTADFQDR